MVLVFIAPAGLYYATLLYDVGCLQEFYVPYVNHYNYKKGTIIHMHTILNYLTQYIILYAVFIHVVLLCTKTCGTLSSRKTSRTNGLKNYTQICTRRYVKNKLTSVQKRGSDCTLYKID